MNTWDRILQARCPSSHQMTKQALKGSQSTEIKKLSTGLIPILIYQ